MRLIKRKRKKPDLEEEIRNLHHTIINKHGLTAHMLDPKYKRVNNLYFRVAKRVTKISHSLDKAIEKYKGKDWEINDRISIAKDYAKRLRNSEVFFSQAGWLDKRALNSLKEKIGERKLKSILRDYARILEEKVREIKRGMRENS